MLEHGDTPTQCCRDTAVEALSALLRLTSEFQREQITDDTIQQHLDIAKTWAMGQGHILESDGDDDIIGRVKMLFTVRQPEAARLLGRDAGHVHWLPDRKAEILTQHGFWDNYRRLLERRIPEEPRKRLDEVTDQILGSLEDPQREGSWDRRGLVMGHVQSGKTNNYIGLICKAADAGYKLIIVLAGTHNNLRAQTQFRIDEAVIGRDTREGSASSCVIGVGLERENKTVISLTSATPDGDFKTTVAENIGVDFGNINSPTVFVVKKNVSILRTLNEWIQSNSARTGGDGVIRGIPVLVIDDEADHASINTANRRSTSDVDPTAINREIRRLVHSCEQVALVGYTATPFANIFIEHGADDPDVGEDLFPRSFIYTLEAPDNYLGPKDVFGIADPAVQGDGTGDVQGLPLTSDVVDSDSWVPDRHNAQLQVPVEFFPESLKRAICSFVLSCAARRARGQVSEHMSMLVHVTPYVKPQEQVRDQVFDYLNDIQNEILYAPPRSENVHGFLREIWEDDFGQAVEILAEDPWKDQSFDELESELKMAVAAIQVKMINGQSADALDYYTYPNGLTAIVIGGAKLSRGLTLPGLSVSYYLRATRMYDTLMQMGRWFGYRPGYLDLCRIFTAPIINDCFRNIAMATTELLGEFRQMEAENRTPEEFGLRVRHSPGMMVTSNMKMQNGTRRRVGFGGKRPEVTSFDIDTDARSRSLTHLEAFLRTVIERGVEDVDGERNDYLWRDVPAQVVVAYLEALGRDDLYRNSRSAVPDYLAAYVQARNVRGSLRRWTVVVKSVEGGSGAPTGGPRTARVAEREVGLAWRDHKGSQNVLSYSIGSLIGSQDEALDLDEGRKKAARDDAKKAGAKDPYGSHYRTKRPHTHGLLIIYLLRGEMPRDDEPCLPEHIPDGDPFVAYCFSFPEEPFDEDNPVGTTVEYIVNNIYDEQGGTMPFRDE